jgi:hypothetical protein
MWNSFKKLLGSDGPTEPVDKILNESGLFSELDEPIPILPSIRTSPLPHRHLISTKSNLIKQLKLNQEAKLNVNNRIEELLNINSLELPNET